MRRLGGAGLWGEDQNLSSRNIMFEVTITCPRKCISLAVDYQCLERSQCRYKCVKYS